MSKAAYNVYAAGAAVTPTYIEDVFSTYVYTGNSGTQTITNGINLSGNGGLVWGKDRSAVNSHYLFDTARGVNQYLSSDTTNQSQSGGGTGVVSAFNANGFSLDGYARINNSGDSFASWTFRKQPKFFDIVTYTGNGTNNRAITHALGSAPGCVIVKNTSRTGQNWPVYHRSTGANTIFWLNATNASSVNSGYFPTAPDATSFYVGTDTDVNQNGDTYVAYLFAHNAGGFGLTGSDNVISCGSYVHSSTVTINVELGFEPQWVLVKNATTAGSGWIMLDINRGFASSRNIAILYANSSATEQVETGSNYLGVYQTGFTSTPSMGGFGFVNGDNIIYIAIRRGPMKVPTTGTSVFKPVVYTGNGGTQSITSDFPVDLAMTDNRTKTSAAATDVKDRMRGYRRHLGANYDYVEQDDSGGYGFVFFDRSTNVGMDAGPRTNDSGVSYVTRLFRRAPGFFDEVCYTGNGTAGTTITHNLGVAPELIICKARTDPGGLTPPWTVGFSFNATTFSYAFLNLTAAATTPAAYAGQSTFPGQPTSSQFTVGTYAGVNYNTGTYVAYLFATCPGVSKVGSYTGNGSTQTIDCGFSSGARFVLIKRTDSTGDWYTFDTARGIIAGNDPFLKFNTTTAEVSSYDAIDPDNSGFIVNNDATNFPINVSSATYIFLAIA